MIYESYYCRRGLNYHGWAALPFECLQEFLDEEMITLPQAGPFASAIEEDAYLIAFFRGSQFVSEVTALVVYSDDEVVHLEILSKDMLTIIDNQLILEGHHE